MSTIKNAGPVATTILSQLGGELPLVIMTGAHSFVGGMNSLTFRFKARARKGIKAIKITLDPMDTYTVEFWKIRGDKFEKVEECEDVYCDELIAVISRATGLALRVPRILF